MKPSHYLGPSNFICRIGYCEVCAREQRPKSGQQYLVVGEEGFHLYFAWRNAPIFGFGPHLYKIHKIIGQNVVYDTWCSMYPCGIAREENIADNSIDYFPNENAKRRGIMLLSDWNALVQYKNDFDYLI